MTSKIDVVNWLIETLTKHGPMSFIDLWSKTGEKPEFSEIPRWSDQYLMETIWSQIDERGKLHLTQDRKFAIGPPIFLD